MKIRIYALLLSALALVLPCLAIADEADSAFDAANKLYAQGKFKDAAQAYEKVLPSSFSSPALYFNEGNAWFKSGEMGRSIIAYRQAMGLTPHDADLQANLQFVRNQVQGPTLRGARWQNWINTLTLNEWTVLETVLIWTTLLLLMILQIKPGLKVSLRSWTVAASCACVVVGSCLGFTYSQRSAQTAVVVLPEVTVRTGPFNESQNAFVVHDGAELRVVDQKDNWLQVSDGAHQIGWINQDAAVLVKNS